MEPDPVLLQEALTSRGYKVLYRQNVWYECAVLNGNEEWNGIGHTEGEALVRCWHRMCPSEFARNLTLKSLPSREAPPEAKKNSPLRYKGRFISAKQAQRLAKEAERAKAEQAEQEAKRAKAEQAEQEAKRRASQAKRTTPKSKVSGNAFAVQAEIFDGSVASPVEPLIPKGWSVPTGQSRICGVVHRRRTHDERPAVKRLSSAECLSALRSTEATVRSSLPLLAVMATRPMHLTMAWWIAGIRRFEAHEPTREVTEAASAVLHAVGRASKFFWPGSVHALKLTCRPQDMVDAYRLAPESYSEATWDEVHDLLGKLVSVSPFDNGWADGDVLLPYPSDPGGVLDRAVKLVERAVGSSVDTLPECRLRKEAKDYRTAERQILVKAGSYLRWVRHCSVSPLLWGHAMGAIRWLASLTRDEELNRVANDQYVPPKPWGEMIASTEHAAIAVAAKKQSTEESKKEVIDSFPLEGEGADLMRWILKALAVLTVPQIVGIVELRPEDVLSLEESQLPSDTRRTWKKRFREIQSHVRERVGWEAPKDDKEEENVKEDEDDLALRAREITRGKKVLLVSNIKNPVLEKRLKTQLACDFTWASLEKKSNAVRPLAQSLGRYDLVCLVTTFLDNTTRGMFVTAAAKGDTPVVFVGSGSQRQVLEALAKKGQPAVE